MTILIIDDDESLRDSLRRSLRGKGYTIIEASEGGEGLNVLKTHPVNLVLIDLFMPGKEGVETIKDVRQQYPGVKIIAMSGGGAKGQTDLLKVAKLMGARQTLEKPFARETLIEAVEQALRAA